MLAGLGTGHYLILLALALLMPVLVIVAFRRASRRISVIPQNDPSFSPPESSKINEAILLVEFGGRIEYINDLARDWFGLHPGELPDLERLMRHARPAEEFLNLCANPAQKRLSIGEQLVEATSYPLPGGYTRMLVAMKPVEFSMVLSQTGEGSSILSLLSDFGRDVSASLEVDDVLHAILLNVSQLISSDLLEIKTWDSASKRLIPFTLDPAGGSGIQRASLTQFGELTEHLLQEHKPLLVTDVRTPPPSLEHVNGNSPVQSYLGLPLLADRELVGTLELGHLTPGALGKQDLELIQLVSSQVAHSLRNAIRFESEQKRSSELSGLANLAQALGASQDYSNLIQRLIESVAPLFPVDVLGFILYDEGKKALEAQSPFQGLPSHIVDIYRASIAPNSPAETIILEKSLIATRNAAADQSWRELGLQTLAQAASLRESVLAPMISGDRLVGYFQVSNRKGERVHGPARSPACG
jgi:GAF domain-containing protein